MKRLVLCLAALALATSLASCSKATPQPAPTVNMDVGVGTPPSEGWRWVVAEIVTGADEVKEAPNAGHDFFWIFYVLSGSNEVTMGDGTKLASAGEGIMVPAKQQHSHRYPPQSKVLAFDVRSANENPSAFHRGTKVLLSDKVTLRPAADYKVRVRTYSIDPGSQRDADTIQDPNFVHVIEGTLTTTVGKDVTRTEAGKAFSAPLNTKFVMKNEGTTKLRYVVADVHP